MIKELKAVEFKGSIEQDEDISAIASFGNFLALGSDESKRKIQILENVNASYQVRDDLTIELPVLSQNEGQEIDIEGMAISKDNTLFVIGSHSLKRSKVKASKTYLENRNRIARVISEERKNSIFKLTLDPQTGQEQTTETRQIINIKEILAEDSILGRFMQIPSKENGIDIEGIAADGNTLYIGFRGPVLRLNYVPVMVLEDYQSLEYEMRFVNLRGNGIRDLTKVNDGFLIIAGAVGDGLNPYQIYFWNGLDTIPGVDKQQEAQLTLLGEIPTPDGAKAEGIAVLAETCSTYQVMIVYDGLPCGAPKLFQVTKPALLE
ncbi:MAG: DUF3616 domain-containing protein [Cyanobacteria bacterium P01_A01_bin.40]